MKIKEWYIDGFGIFHDYSIKNLPPGLTIFTGPNEAGKSTLLEFLRGILFGYHKPHGKDYIYTPLNGGTHGGTINLESGGEIIKLERYSKKNKHPIITLPGGKKYSADEFRIKILGGADSKLFKSVFAFSLDELYDFSSLSENEIGDGIAAAGIAGAGASIKKVIHELDIQAKEILLNKKSTIKQLAENLKERKKELIEARKTAEKYPGLIAEEDELRNEEASLKKKVNALRQLDYRYNMLKQLWPAWNEIIQTEESLRDLVPADSSIVFVGESPSLLLAGTLPGDALAEVTELMAKHDKHLEGYRSNIRQLPIEKNKFYGVEKNLSDKYRKLGTGWDEEKINTFDTSISKEREIHAMGDEIDASLANFREIQRKHQNAKDDLKKALQNLKRIENEFQDMEYKDEERLEEKKKALVRFRANRNELTSLEKDFQLQKDRLSDIEQKIQSLESEIKPVFPKWSIFLTMGFSITAFITAIWLLFKGDLIAVLVLFFLAAAGGISTIILNLKRNQIIKIETHLKENLSSQSAIMESIKSNLNSCNKAIENLRKAINKDAVFLEIFSNIPIHEVELLVSKVDEQLRKLGTIKYRLKEAQINSEEDEKKEKNLSDELEEAEHTKENVKRKWHNWVEAQGIEIKYTPKELIDLFREVEKARELSRSYKELQTKINEIEHNIEEWGKKSNDLFGAGGFPVDESVRGEALITKFNDLLEKLNKRKEHFNTIRSRSIQIIEGLGKGKEAEDLLNQLVEGKIQEWEQESERIKREITDIEEQQKDKMTQLINKEIERGNIEKASNIAEIEIKIEALQTEISAAIHKWRIISFAKAMIDETFNKFVRNRQPAVYEDASKYFDMITKKRYPNVVYDLEAKEPAVFDRHSRRKKVNELSRGTREQLYLCIRLGLASEFAVKGASLPLVMDDVLVNFDPDRAEAMAEALREYSERRQILLFTCHPNTEMIFKKLDQRQKTNVIEI